MFNTYKHLHSLTCTLASCLLNNQQQALTLISINKILSVSYCSPVMLCVVFVFLLCIVLSALPSTSRKEFEVVVSRGTDREWGGGVQTSLHLDTFRIQAKALSVSYYSVVLSFIPSYVMNRTDFLNADGGHFSILQHKMVLFFLHGNFTVSFYESVITTDRVKWLQQTALSLYESAHFNIISCDKLHVNPPPLAAPSHVAARLSGSFRNNKSVTCRTQSAVSPSVITSGNKPSVGFP